jgi:glycosyltransferase involved in cell wall biosynthesis
MRICLVPHLSGVGGMVSFQHKLSAGLQGQGFDVCNDLDYPDLDAILVIGGTRRIAKLWRARRQGIRIVQRLDGMNWLHRVRPTGLIHYLRSEYGNLLLSLIRRRFADHIVYQSEFSRDWWERQRGPTPVTSSIVHNGVDLDTFTPSGKHHRPDTSYRVLLVEGNLMGGYEAGLEIAIQLVASLAELAGQLGNPVELMVVGRVGTQVKERWQAVSPVPIQWTGQVPHERIPELNRSAHLLYSADINPACPNSVIEAMGCGLPVLAFDTGAIPELIAGESGRVVSYGGDPWRLEPPDMPVLVEAATEILTDQALFRRGARDRAELAFGLDQMVAGYMQALL